MLKLGDSVVANQGKNQVDTLLVSLSGIIEYSLYQTIVDSGASPLLVNNLADVYAWEIDFFGLQKGDHFKVIYEKYIVKGEEAGIGPIKAAWFNHMNEEFYAIPYDQGEGLEFFDREGKSLRKTFLKAPLKYNRISSHFSNSRLHPILKIKRPHHGVDYAAPKGTPVVAVGDGVVTKAGYSGGAGNMVKIKHNSNYETAYLHFWKYGEGIKTGVRVKQGQVIGYVGSTGHSTGPHLDFRFYKNGVAVDPLKVDPPSANPIKEEEMGNFRKTKEYWSKEIDKIHLSVQPEII
jgi:murein DD-endopeptidase MepM/ murein hydrolase activator NlpD